MDTGYTDIADDFRKMASDDPCEEEFEREEIDAIFRKSVSDYRRLAKRCEKEGTSISDAAAEYKAEFEMSPSIADRMAILENLRGEIQSMMSACSPPGDLIEKYSDDLVSRMERGDMDFTELYIDD